jgi:phage-related protein
LLTKVIYELTLLREFGLELLGESRVKKLTDEIYELRTRLGSDINRVLFGIRKEQVILLAASFVRKSQKTPERWIETAATRL